MNTLKEKFIHIKNLYQKIFLLVLGSALMVIPFYASGLNMLLLTEKQAEWATVHWIFLAMGIIFFVGGWAFNSLAKIIVKLATGVANKHTPK